MLKNKIDWSKLKRNENSNYKKKLETPEVVWEHFCDYAQGVDDNPSIKHEILKGGDSAGKTVEIEYQRPYTWSGFYAYLYEIGVVGCTDTLREYKNNRKGLYDDYQDVMARIDKVMYAQKFEGATTGHFSAVIIARDLGLAEKREIKEESKQSLVDYTQLSDDVLEEITKAIENNKTDES